MTDNTAYAHRRHLKITGWLDTPVVHVTDELIEAKEIELKNAKQQAAIGIVQALSIYAHMEGLYSLPVDDLAYGDKR